MWVIDSGEYLGHVDAWDRGVQFGDGLFETVLVLDGKPLHLQEHLTRLNNGLKVLSIDLEIAEFEVQLHQALIDLLEHSGLREGVLKVIITRGDSARGYAIPNNIKSNATFFLSKLPDFHADIYTKGVTLKLCDTQCGIQPQLSGLKHLNRLENVLAKQELCEEFDGLMSNFLGFVIEGTMSNVFFEKNGMLFTPNLNISGVKGVMRSLVMQVCQRQAITLQELDIKQADLPSFDAAFICNSVMGVVPVKRIKQQVLQISKTTKLLQKELNTRGENE